MLCAGLLQVYSLESFASQHAEQVQQCAQRLAVFSQAAFEVVQAACRDDLVHLQQQLETFNAKADITTITTTTSSSAASASISTLPLSPGGGTGSSSHKSISELLKSRSSMARHKVSTFPAGSSSTSADGKAPQQVWWAAATSPGMVCVCGGVIHQAMLSSCLLPLLYLHPRIGARFKQAVALTHLLHLPRRSTPTLWQLLTGANSGGCSAFCA